MCPSSAAICIRVLPLLFTKYTSWPAESPSSRRLIAARLPYFAAMCNGVLPAPSVVCRSLEPHVGSLIMNYNISMQEKDNCVKPQVMVKTFGYSSTGIPSKWQSDFLSIPRL